MTQLTSKYEGMKTSIEDNETYMQVWNYNFYNENYSRSVSCALN
jgi:hypothetical protein